MKDWKMELIYLLLQKLQEIDLDVADLLPEEETPEAREERECAELEELKRKIFGD